MLTGVAVMAIGGTETTLPQVGVATAQAAKLKTQTVAEAKADLQNAVDYFKAIVAKNSKDSGNTASSSDPVADTQDAHEYEESTAQSDASSGTNSDNSDSDSGSSAASSTSSKPDSHSASEFSKESINAPGNAGSTTASSNTSSTTPVARANSKKGNLPGTGEDSNQTVLLAAIGLLGILGLGGTALALWLRQRKHVNND